jgi:hypothetical protein
MATLVRGAADLHYLHCLMMSFCFPCPGSRRPCPRPRRPRNAPNNLLVALVRDEPSECPTSPSSLPTASYSSAVSTIGCGTTSTGIILDMGNVCTAERTTLYLWVAVKGSSSVSAVPGGGGPWAPATQAKQPASQPVQPASLPDGLRRPAA